MPQMGPNERAVFLRSLTSTEYAAGAKPRVEFGGIDKMDKAGRHGHLVGFFLVCTWQYDVVQATFATFDGRRTLAKLGNVQLEAANGLQKYLPGTFDWRRLQDDQALRFGFLPVTDPADIADQDATNASQTFIAAYRFAPPSVRPGSELDGAIPLVLIDHNKRGDDCLKFIPTALSITGLTDDGFTGIDAYAIVRYDEDLNIDAAWQLREEEETKKVFDVPAAPGDDPRMPYAVVRHVHEDTGAQDNSDYDKLSISIGDQLSVALTARQQGRLAAVLYGMATSGYSLDQSADLLDFASAAPQFTPCVISPPGARRVDMARGPFRFDAGTRSTHTLTRILHFQWTNMPEGVGAILAGRLAVPEKALVPVQKAVNAIRNISPGLLPRKVRVKAA